MAVQRSSASRYTLTLPVATASTKALPKGLGRAHLPGAAQPRVIELDCLPCMLSKVLSTESTVVLLADLLPVMSFTDKAHNAPDASWRRRCSRPRLHRAL